MNWQRKTTICVAAVLVAAVAYAVSASVLGIKTSGGMGARIVHNAITISLGWGLCLIFLKLEGIKIT